MQAHICIWGDNVLSFVNVVRDHAEGSFLDPVRATRHQPCRSKRHDIDDAEQCTGGEKLKVKRVVKADIVLAGQNKGACRNKSRSRAHENAELLAKGCSGHGSDQRYRRETDGQKASASCNNCPRNSEHDDPNERKRNADGQFNKGSCRQIPGTIHGKGEGQHRY